MIPPEFDISRGSVSVSTFGGTLKANPESTLNTATRTLHVKEFNNEYLEQYQVSYFRIDGIANPDNIKRT